MKIIDVDINQSIWDIAIQEYGDPCGVKQLIIDNSQLNFNDSISPGTKIRITAEPINKVIVDFLDKKGLKPSTAVMANNAMQFEDDEYEQFEDDEPMEFED